MNQRPSTDKSVVSLRADQLAATFVRCCEAGQVAYPDPCPWHGVSDPQYQRLEES